MNNEKTVNSTIKDSTVKATPKKKKMKETSEIPLKHGKLLTTIMTIVTLVYVCPIFIVLMNSFKANTFVKTDTFAWPTGEALVGWANYIKGFTFGNYPFFKSVLYSFVITVLSTALILICTSMAAWYIARVDSMVCKIVYYLFVFSMVVPFQMVMFTLSNTADSLELNTPWTIPVIYLGFGAGMAVFMFTGFIKGLPLEIEEAAAIDGCGPIRTFFIVIIPMLKPTLISVGILEIMWIWNDYLLPYLVLDLDQYRTIPIHIQYLQGSYGSSNSNGSFNYNGNTSYLITELPNPNLRWEKTATFEVGADLSFFANRLNTNLTYYNRLTSDKYAALSFPTSTGFSSVTNNNGEFRNQGIEIELSGKIIDSKDWTWSASGNIAFNKNKIVSLPDNGMERNRINAFQVYTGNGDEKKWVGGQQEGQEPGILYLYQADGIYRSYDEIPANLVRKYGSRTYYGPEAWNKLTAEQQNATTNFPIQPGDTKFHDVNGDDVIDEFDKVKVGATSPRWTGGFNTTLRWKNFQLYGRFDYALGFWLYENSGTQSTTPWFMGCYQGTYNTPTMYYDTWSESNPNAKYPRYLFADQNGKNNYIASTMFAYRGDYLAIREISLSYSLPESVAKMLKMQRAEVSITGQNLGYITGAKNVGSPEANPKDNGAVGQGYSLPRTILFGVNLTF